MLGIFHIHTCYSLCSSIKLEKLKKFVEKRGIKGICITDHNTLEGYKKAKKLLKKVEVVPGVEVSCREGELLAVGVEVEIRKKIGCEEFIERVKEGGGIIIVPHPFDKFRKGVGRKMRKLKVDGVEIFNSRSLIKSFDELALKYAKILNLKLIAGSDAHFLSELDNCYLEYEGNFFDSIRKGKIEIIISKKANPSVLFFSPLLKFNRELRLFHAF